MKIRNLRVKAFDAISPGDLQTVVNDWLSPPDADEVPRTEEQFVDISFDSDGASFYCYITYVEA